jgi:hypothetical protein
MALKLKSTGGGSVTIDVPSTASDFGLNLPAVGGNIVTTGDSGSVNQSMLAPNVGGTGPAFRASRNSDQSISPSTWTKVSLSTETFDTNNCFDSTTTYRFTPNVAGYYQVNGRLFGGGSSIVSTYVSIYRNGALFGQAGVGLGSGSIGAIPQISEVLYLNGTTDYIELYGYVAGSSPIFSAATGQFCVFSASLVRAA